MELTDVKFKATPERQGWQSVWAVDNQGRYLHTEPVCVVPVPWHTWFVEWLEGIDDCPHQMVALLPTPQDSGLECSACGGTLTYDRLTCAKCGNLIGTGGPRGQGE